VYNAVSLWIGPRRQHVPGDKTMFWSTQAHTRRGFANTFLVHPNRKKGGDLAVPFRRSDPAPSSINKPVTKLLLILYGRPRTRCVGSDICKSDLIIIILNCLPGKPSQKKIPSFKLYDCATRKLPYRTFR
jgi:hypothetical protein